MILDGCAQSVECLSLFADRSVGIGGPLAKLVAKRSSFKAWSAGVSFPKLIVNDDGLNPRWCGTFSPS